MTFNKPAAGTAMILALAVLAASVKITAVMAPYDAGSAPQLSPKAPDEDPAPRRYYDGFDPHLSGLYGPDWLGGQPRAPRN